MSKSIYYKPKSIAEVKAAVAIGWGFGYTHGTPSDVQEWSQGIVMEGLCMEFDFRDKYITRTNQADSTVPTLDALAAALAEPVKPVKPVKEQKVISGTIHAQDEFGEVYCWSAILLPDGGLKVGCCTISVFDMARIVKEWTAYNVEEKV